MMMMMGVMGVMAGMTMTVMVVGMTVICAATPHLFLARLGGNSSRSRRRVVFMLMIMLKLILSVEAKVYAQKRQIV